MKLIQQTRKVKEDLLRPDAAEEAKISILGSGSRLIGGTKVHRLRSKRSIKLLSKASFL